MINFPFQLFKKTNNPKLYYGHYIFYFFDECIIPKTKGNENLINNPRTKFNDLESKYVKKDYWKQKKKWKDFDKEREGK